MLSLRTRRDNLGRMAKERFDLLVIGGGINGAGIALDAASRGLKTALIEKRDFSSGTSSKSSKLIHGGLRYLRQLQFKVTLEASREKNLLKQLAPHLVEDLPFLFPVSAGIAGRAAVNAGLWIYDLAAGLPRGMVHKKISKENAVRYLPGLREKRLKGAYLYYDAKADDCRLVLHVLKKAAEKGACVANYARLDSFEDDHTVTVVADGRELTIEADAIVNATGVWCDDVLRRRNEDASPLVRPSKGIHLVLSRDRLPLEGAVILQSPEDGRVIFLIPWDDRVVVGTTDTDYDGDIDHPRADDRDIEYLLELLNRNLPNAHYDRKDVLSTYAGLRPLVRSEAGAPSRASRDHEIVDDGIITVMGGKLTTYRLMAAEVVDRVCGNLGREEASRTDEIPLFAAERSDDPLVRNYGSEADRIGNRRPLVEGLPYVEGEIEYAMENEMAVTLADLFCRRMRLALYDHDQGRGLAEKIALRLAPKTGWNVTEELDRFEEELLDFPR